MLSKTSKKNTVSHTQKKKVFEKHFETYFKTKKILEKLKRISSENKDAKFDGLYQLLKNEDFILQAITNLNENKGTSTSGIEKKTLDRLNTKTVKKISIELRTRQYKFNAVKRIYS